MPLGWECIDRAERFAVSGPLSLRHRGMLPGTYSLAALSTLRGTNHWHTVPRFINVCAYIQASFNTLCRPRSRAAYSRLLLTRRRILQ